MATGNLGSLHVDLTSLKELTTVKTGESPYSWIHKNVYQSNDVVLWIFTAKVVMTMKSFNKRYELKYTTLKIKAMHVIMAIMTTITLTDDDYHDTAAP